MVRILLNSDLAQAVNHLVRAFIYFILNTPSILLPDGAPVRAADKRSTEKHKKQLSQVVDDCLDLEDDQKRVIKERFVDQIAWASNRANRDRDNNDLIRWWQIILGVLIPVMIQSGDNGWQTVATLAGIFVAVLTGISQFRRPEERWRHYRVLSERYQLEFWKYVSLSGEIYEDTERDGNSAPATHANYYRKFCDRMIAIGKEDLSQFFGTVVPPSQSGYSQKQDETKLK